MIKNSRIVSQKLKISFLLCIFLYLIDNQLFAQNTPKNCKWVKYQTKAFQIDTLSILPNSLRISYPLESELQIDYDINTNQLTFKGLNSTDSVLICYQTLPFNLTKTDFKRNPALYDSTDNYLEEFFFKQNPFEEKREELFNLKGINKTGILTRGIGFGTNQSATVTSAFNLQLDGNLTDDITITAAISDQNVPYQPEGNTLQLQDFDRVFIKLSHKVASLLVGDIVFQNKEGYFLKHYKNVQGGLVEAKYNIGNQQVTTSAGIAVSKGKFASALIPSIEGVQGPYRLSGPNGERFIIILANSEKVFIDGKQLTRGFNFDYVIDYNQAEITFNPNILITQFTRIRVDFEYSELNYARNLQTISHYQSSKKTDIFFNYYREADNQRNDLINLTDVDKLALSLSGDGLGLISGIDTLAEFRTGEVLYKLVDITSPNGSYPNVLVYSTNPDSAKYRASFTEVGLGQGDYIRLNTTVNGQIYQWVEPINGEKQGNFMPVRAVPLPISKQLITGGINYKLTDNERFFGEVAFSNLDLNRFSSQGDADNQGNAFKIGYVNTGKNFKNWKDYQWLAHLDVEFNNRFFRPIDRFRYIEFDRDWSTQIDSTQIADYIFNTGLGLRKNADNQAVYKASGRKRGNQVNGWQHSLNFSQEIKRILIKADAFLMNNDQSRLKSEWQRLNTDVAYRLKLGAFGYRFLLDKNKVFVQANDSIISTAMNFREQQVYFKTVDSAKVQFQVNYSWRTDNLPIEGKIQKHLDAQTLNLIFGANIKQTQQINLNLTYRSLRYLREPIPVDLNTENIMGRLDWNGFFFQKHLRSELTLASNSGRELQREFVFIPVQPGQGTHTWRDDNGDNVQDLNEFYVAINPDERLFIKVFVPTTTYLNAFNTNFSYRLNWEAPRNWLKKKGLKGFIGKFSNISAWTINRKFTNPSIAGRLLPFYDLPENDVLSNQSNLKSTLFFNRSALTAGWDLNYTQNSQKQLLTNGFEERNRFEWRLNTRNNLNKFFNLRFSLASSRQQNRSDFLLTRNYTIQNYQAGPELAYQPTQNFRIITHYTYANKKNTDVQESPESAQIHQVSLEMRWTKLSQRNLIANLRLLRINYQGQVNTPISYDMLEALQPGFNVTWSVSWQQRLSNGLQLNLNYDGRKSPTTRLINIGRVQLTALF